MKYPLWLLTIIFTAYVGNVLCLKEHEQNALKNSGEVIYLEEGGRLSDLNIFKVTETPEKFIIYIKHPEEWFHGEKNPKFTVSAEGRMIFIESPHKPGTINDLNLPHPVAKDLWRTELLKPNKISENEIELIIPKDQSRSALYYWWHRGKFYRIDPLNEPRQVTPPPFPWNLVP